MVPVALVTGGSRGIGELIARGYVAAGAKATVPHLTRHLGRALAARHATVTAIAPAPSRFRGSHAGLQYGPPSADTPVRCVPCPPPRSRAGGRCGCRTPHPVGNNG